MRIGLSPERIIDCRKGESLNVSQGPGRLVLVDTTALIQTKDLVVTVDRSIAHLAGALGKKVWVILPFYPDWLRMADRPDSPWYPTLRLCRQSASGDWRGMISAVATKLARGPDKPAGLPVTT